MMKLILFQIVRSFGTEDRETAYPIMPQPTVYDYILFRGSDIKDIRVVNNVSIPNDPAIMQMHLPPQNQQPGFPPQQMPPIQGNPLNQFGSFANLQQGPPPTSMSGQNLSQQPSQSQMLSPQQKQQSSSQQGNNQSNILSTTNSLHSSAKKSSELSKIDLPFSTSSSSTSSEKPTNTSHANLLRKQNNPTSSNIKSQGVQKQDTFLPSFKHESFNYLF